MSIGPPDIENVFSAFHDGSIEGYRGDLNAMTLTKKTLELEELDTIAKKYWNGLK